MNLRMIVAIAGFASAGVAGYRLLAQRGSGGSAPQPILAPQAELEASGRGREARVPAGVGAAATAVPRFVTGELDREQEARAARARAAGENARALAEGGGKSPPYDPAAVLKNRESFETRERKAVELAGQRVGLTSDQMKGLREISETYLKQTWDSIAATAASGKDPGLFGTEGKTLAKTKEREAVIRLLGSERAKAYRMELFQARLQGSRENRASPPSVNP